MAERLAKIKGENVLLIEQRNHIGGNCYDCYDDHGILIHKFGPHIFHTDNEQVWNYLSEFTDWHHYQHKVLSQIDGHEVTIPFNLNTLYALLPESIASRIEAKLIENFGFGSKLSIKELQDCEDQDLQFLAIFVHDKVFLNYTVKQWGVEPDKISPKVAARLSIIVSKDDRYFHDRYQGLPKFGYTRMFANMLNLSSIKLLLNTTMKDLVEIDHDKLEIRFMGNCFCGKLIYTGMLDDLFNNCYGKLPYRALKFEFEKVKRKYFQKSAVINYPNNYDFTRITEFKHMTGQDSQFSTILREYPTLYNNTGTNKNTPSYPIATQENNSKVKKYMSLVKRSDQIVILGRLAEYKYYDMDKLVEKVLSVIKNL